MLRLVALTLGILFAGLTSAAAGTYTLSFDGTMDFSGTGMFGDATAVPFHFSLTVDPTLNTSQAFYAASGPGADSFYGFSASSLISTSLSFETYEWTVSDIQPRGVAMGNSADFYLDSDLSSTAPSRIWLSMDGGNGSLQLGGAIGGSNGTNFTQAVTLMLGEDTWVTQNPVTMQATAVPEPATVGAIAGLVALSAAVFVRRRRA